MAKSSTPTLGKFRLRHFALRFGAPIDDQRPEAIVDQFDRERCFAFIEYKRASIATGYKFNCAHMGVPFGTAEQRATADAWFRADNARVEDFHRQQLEFPALTRAKGYSDLLNPFGDDDSAPEFGSRIDDPVPASLLPEWSAATVWQRFTTMNEHRAAFICLYSGSPDETPEGVPAENVADFEAHIEYENQSRQALFEEACQEHGAKCFFEDIPESQKSNALYDLESRIARFADSCKYELEILRIAIREEAERAEERDREYARRKAAKAKG